MCSSCGTYVRPAGKVTPKNQRRDTARKYRHTHRSLHIYLLSHTTHSRTLSLCYLRVCYVTNVGKKKEPEGFSRYLTLETDKLETLYLHTRLLRC
jgi:hypothetical protein